MRSLGPAVQDVVEAGRDIAVVVEAEDLGLRQRVGELVAVPFGQAADGRDLGPRIGRAEQLVDGFLLGRLDETAGVDHDDARVLAVSGELPAACGQPGGQFLGVDLITGAAERDETDGAAAAAAVIRSGRTRSMDAGRLGG